MLSVSELDTILNPASSDQDILSAFNGLQLEHLNPALIAAAVDKISSTADIHPDMFIELHELGRFAVDCSGTGGSGVEHFNTSTCVAFVLAAAGFKVAKFGARAASGKSGSFDFLEALGIGSDLPVQKITDALSVCGVAFVYAPQVYPHLARLVPLRKKFAQPTILNYIGPLLNPVRPAYRLMGVSSDLARKIVAQQLKDDLKTKDALLVTSGGRLDELAFDATNDISLIKDKEVHEFQVEPHTLPLIHKTDASRGTPVSNIEFNTKTNLRIFNEIIVGDDCNSSSYKMILLNSAAAFFMLRATDSISEGIVLASELIAAGAVSQNVATCRRFYEQLSR